MAHRSTNGVPQRPLRWCPSSLLDNSCRDRRSEYDARSRLESPHPRASLESERCRSHHRFPSPPAGLAQRTAPLVFAIPKRGSKPSVISGKPLAGLTPSQPTAYNHLRHDALGISQRRHHDASSLPWRVTRGSLARLDRRPALLDLHPGQGRFARMSRWSLSIGGVRRQ